MIKMEQPLKAWGIFNDEFAEVELIVRRWTSSTHTDASKAKGVDPDAREAEAAVNQQALQSRAPDNHVVQRRLRDPDHLKCELLKLGELKPLYAAVGEAASFNGGNTEGGGEAGDGCRHR